MNKPIKSTPQLPFEHPEDEIFFTQLLCQPGETIQQYAAMFDFRPPSVKRKELTNRQKRELKYQLAAVHGCKCLLRYHPSCAGNEVTLDDLELEHLIPLSSNELNKKLKRIPAAPGKKVSSQSFGSNHQANLVLACHRCNSHKKHKILPRAKIQEILAQKGRAGE